MEKTLRSLKIVFETILFFLKIRILNIIPFKAPAEIRIWKILKEIGFNLIHQLFQNNKARYVGIGLVLRAGIEPCS
jgi:hypothetical protein